MGGARGHVHTRVCRHAVTGEARVYTQGTQGNTMRGPSSDPTSPPPQYGTPSYSRPPPTSSHCYYTMVPSARSYFRWPCVLPLLPVAVQLESVTLTIHLSAGQPLPSQILGYLQCRVTDGSHPIQHYRGLFQRPKMTAPPSARFSPRGRALAPLRLCSVWQGFWPSAGFTSPPGQGPHDRDNDKRTRQPRAIKGLYENSI